VILTRPLPFLQYFLSYNEEWFKVDSNSNSILWRLSNVFKSFKDNNKFVGDLVDRVCELAWDDKVNSYNIEKFEE
jgi:hypothetical protein